MIKMDNKQKKILFIVGGITTVGIIAYLILKPKSVALPNTSTTVPKNTTQPVVNIPRGTSGINANIDVNGILGTVGSWFGAGKSSDTIVDSDSHGNYQESDGTWYTYAGNVINNYVGDQAYE